MIAVLVLTAFMATAVCLFGCFIVYRWTSLRRGLPLDLEPYQAFAGSLDIAILVLSSDLRNVFYASPGANALFGLDSSTSFHSVLEDLVVEDDRESLQACLCAKSKSGAELEFRIRKDDGISWIQGRVYFVPGFFTDRLAMWAQDISRNKRDELTIVQARDYEFSVGARIQQSLLLGSPNREYEFFHIACLTLPSQHVDGDFIDFFDSNEEVLDLILGDVMGKGIAAALTGAAARNAFVKGRLKLAESAAAARFSIRDIVQAAEELIACKMISVGTFVTLVYGRLDGRSGLFRYVDCGHTSIIQYERRTGQCWKLKGSNTPMGFLPSQQYAEYAVPIEEGDVLFLYSDGISEASNSEGELFGEERIMKLIRSSADLDASGLLEKIKQITFAYSAGHFTDDVTGITVKILDYRDPVAYVSREFTQQPESLRLIREFFGTCLEKHPGNKADGERRESILIALGEAASNVFKHNSSVVQHPCTAACRRWDGWMAFYLYYHGVDYDWEEPRIPVLESFQTSGYGLYLIDETMDSVTLGTGTDGAFRLCMLLEIPTGGDHERN